MKKSELHKLIKEIIQERFFDQEGDDSQHEIIPDYHDAALYFIEKKRLGLPEGEMVQEFGMWLDEHTDSLPESIETIIDVPDEPMWGADDVDPAGGGGPSSHI